MGKNVYTDFLSAGVNDSDFEKSTFNLVDVPTFRNFKFWTLFWYLFTWIMVILSIGLLCIDTYTCVNLLAFNKWSNQDIKPYRFDIAKWVFSGCILFQFCLVGYHWIIAYRVLQKKKIAQTYLNSYAKKWYTLKSYNYHCLFYALEPTNFFDWCTFLVYEELDVAIQVLVIDTPRQVINVLTILYYATDGDTSNDVIANIKKIATTNLKLAIILSLMVVSLAIYSIFLFRFILAILLYLPIKIKTYRKGFKRIKKYCVFVINSNTRRLVKKYHKPRQELLETGLMSLEEMKMNPLLNSSTTFFEDFEYVQDHNNAFNMESMDSRQQQPFNENDPFKDPEPHSYNRIRPPYGNNSRVSDTSLTHVKPFKETEAYGFNSDTSYTGGDGFDTPKLNILKLDQYGNSKELLISGEDNQRQFAPPNGLKNPFGDDDSHSTIPSSLSTNWNKDDVESVLDTYTYSETPQYSQLTMNASTSYVGGGNSVPYGPPPHFQHPARSISGTGSLVYDSTIVTPPPSYHGGFSRLDSIDNSSSTEYFHPPNHPTQHNIYSNSNSSHDSQLTITWNDQSNARANPPDTRPLVSSENEYQAEPGHRQRNESLNLPYPTRGPSMYEDRDE